MDVHVHRVENGKWKENTYIVSDDQAVTAIIDPGENTNDVQTYIANSKLQVRAIINTHGHYDHVAGVSVLKDLYQVPFYLHVKDIKLLKAANFYRQIFEGGKNIQIPKVDVALNEQVSIQIGNLNFEFLQTPGHTEGGVSIKLGSKLFTGDNIIGGRLGRTDLPGGNRQLLEASMQKICALPEDTQIFPGHGPMVILKEILERLIS